MPEKGVNNLLKTYWVGNDSRLWMSYPTSDSVIFRSFSWSKFTADLTEKTVTRYGLDHLEQPTYSPEELRPKIAGALVMSKKLITIWGGPHSVAELVNSKNWGCYNDETRSCQRQANWAGWYISVNYRKHKLTFNCIRRKKTYQPLQKKH